MYRKMGNSGSVRFGGLDSVGRQDGGLPEIASRQRLGLTRLQECLCHGWADRNVCATPHTSHLTPHFSLADCAVALEHFL